MANIQIVTFYKFIPIAEAQISQIAEQLEVWGLDLELRGLTILAPEGINATLSGTTEAWESYKIKMEGLLGLKNVVYKPSQADFHPFHDFKVKVRPEIVTLKTPEHVPPADHHRHLSPAEWNKVLKNEDDVVVLDTRNDYETEIGKFKRAVDPKITEFNEFPEYLKQSGIDKNKKVLIYCTGGIRCEKAILEMERQGFNNVFQLEGGILNYLKEFPNDEYEGECFVFDYRVAVDQELNPTQQFKLCPHCGRPAAQPIDCIQCGRADVICNACYDQGPQLQTCSKNCSHHYRMGHKSRRLHADSHKKRGLRATS